MIPFKLYVNENGKTYSYQDRTPLDIETKEENKRPVYTEEEKKQILCENAIRLLDM